MSDTPQIKPDYYLRTPDGLLVNTGHISVFNYKDGELRILLSAGERIAVRMPEQRGQYWLTRLAAERGGASDLIPPPQTKGTE